MFSAIKAVNRSCCERDTDKYLKKKGIKFTYEKERITWLNVKTRYYKHDCILENGMLIKIKGCVVSKERRKYVEIRQQPPDLDLRFGFQNSRIKLYKRAKVGYSDWCERHGFKYAEKVIPDEWLEE